MSLTSLTPPGWFWMPATRSAPIGAMMNVVSTRASAYRTRLGGTCCTPSALRTSESTMAILRKA
eukprot:2681-Eustigmatos_ZCMA.PRE.1